MSLPVLPLKGTCRCGDVGVELTAPPLMTAACHCTGCQKMSASAFSITAMVPPDGFAVTRGQTERGGLGEGPIDHRCCPRCLTWMFTRIEGVDGFINIRPTMFDDTSWFTPFIETMTQEKPQLPRLSADGRPAGIDCRIRRDGLIAQGNQCGSPGR